MLALKNKHYFVFLLLLISTSILLCDVNTANASQADELVDLNLLINVLDINPKTNMATIIIGASLQNFPFNFTTLDINVRGGGSVYVHCNRTGTNGINGWHFQGFSEQTNWLLGGTGENFPLNSYTLNFQIDSIASVEKNFTLDSVGAIFDGPNSLFMRNNWKSENVSMIPITSQSSNNVTFGLEKTDDRLINELVSLFAPIIGCYYVLGASLILNPKEDFNGRLRIYLSVFVFSSTFLFTIQSILPFHSSLSFPEFLLSNLTISTAIFTISTIIGNKRSNPINASQNKDPYPISDTIGLLFALTVFALFYVISTLGELSTITSIILSYIIMPSYSFSIFFKVTKEQFSKQKRFWITLLIAVLSPLVLQIIIELLK